MVQAFQQQDRAGVSRRGAESGEIPTRGEEGHPRDPSKGAALSSHLCPGVGICAANTAVCLCFPSAPTAAGPEDGSAEKIRSTMGVPSVMQTRGDSQDSPGGLLRLVSLKNPTGKEKVLGEPGREQV